MLMEVRGRKGLATEKHSPQNSILQIETKGIKPSFFNHMLSNLYAGASL